MPSRSCAHAGSREGITGAGAIRAGVIVCAPEALPYPWDGAMRSQKLVDVALVGVDRAGFNLVEGDRAASDVRFEQGVDERHRPPGNLAGDFRLGAGADALRELVRTRGRCSLRSVFDEVVAIGPGALAAEQRGADRRRGGSSGA